MTRREDVVPWVGRPRAQTMMNSDEVEAMLHQPTSLRAKPSR
jgi:hypothetical protein